MKKLVVLTGAGMSAESGIKTFRDADGLWEGHDIYEVASPQGFAANPTLVLDFYNQRRRQLLTVSPNLGHKNIAKLENYFDVTIVTQNIDNLHEQAGSTNVIHLHGELLKGRSSKNNNDVFEWKKDINLGDVAKDGSQIRPHIVWFGEDVPMIEDAISVVEKADVLAIIGTSMLVYPAASLVNFISPNTPIYFIDPKPNITKNAFNNLTIIKDVASSGTQKLIDELID